MIDERLLERVVEFHGHMCPGLAMGVQAAQIALREIGPHAKDEEVVAVVETDMCGVDAIQFLTGCTFGKGNFVHRDWGKNVYSFYRRSDGRAVRIAGRPDAWKRDPEHQELFAKVRTGMASDAEKGRFQELHQAQSRAVLALDPDDLFSVAEILGPAAPEGPHPRHGDLRPVRRGGDGDPGAAPRRPGAVPAVLRRRPGRRGDGGGQAVESLLGLNRARCIMGRTVSSTVAVTFSRATIVLRGAGPPRRLVSIAATSTAHRPPPAPGRAQDHLGRLRRAPADGLEPTAARIARLTPRTLAHRRRCRGVCQGSTGVPRGHPGVRVSFPEVLALPGLDVMTRSIDS